MWIKKKLIKEIIYMLEDLSEISVSALDGQEYYECLYCGGDSLYTSCSIVHEDDCKIDCIIKKLNSLF